MDRFITASSTLRQLPQMSSVGSFGPEARTSHPLASLLHKVRELKPGLPRWVLPFGFLNRRRSPHKSTPPRLDTSRHNPASNSTSDTSDEESWNSAFVSSEASLDTSDSGPSTSPGRAEKSLEPSGMLESTSGTTSWPELGSGISAGKTGNFSDPSGQNLPSDIALSILDNSCTGP